VKCGEKSSFIYIANNTQETVIVEFNFLSAMFNSKVSLLRLTSKKFQRAGFLTAKCAQNGVKCHYSPVSKQYPPHKWFSTVKTEINTLKNNVVVFDIDETLCFGHHVMGRNKSTDAVQAEYNHRNPECAILSFKYDDSSSWYVFRPYLYILLDYLLKKEVRMAFFSAGIEERNIPLISQLLSQTMGEKEYESLISKGQFRVFSRHHMRKVRPHESGVQVYSTGTYVKDLTPIMHNATQNRNGLADTIDDMILVDDNPSYCAQGQAVCIYTPGSYIELEPQHMRIAELRLKNNFYYFLGLFMTCFENDSFKTMSLRERISCAIKLDERYDPKHQIPDPNFEIQMSVLGLAEVRKTHPEAVFYGAETFLRDDPSLPRAAFHHSAAEIEALLDALLSEKRSFQEPTMFMFLRYLEEDGLHYYSNVPSIRQKFDVIVKKMAAKVDEQRKE
jgi:hypothetical protein